MVLRLCFSDGTLAGIEIARSSTPWSSGDKSGSRMRAMILFLLDTGVRSSELVSIELCDVLFDEGRVRVLQPVTA